MTTDTETTEQYLTFVRSRFLISVLVFVSRDYKLGTGWHWFSLQIRNLLFQLHSPGGGGVRSWPSVPYGANFFQYASPCLWNPLPNSFHLAHPNQSPLHSSHLHFVSSSFSFSALLPSVSPFLLHFRLKTCMFSPQIFLVLTIDC